MSTGLWTDPSPDPTNPDILDNLRNYLISQGLVRDPRDASQQWRLPPLWIAPRFGVPDPTVPGKPVEGQNVGESDTLVLGIFPATDTPPPRYEGFRRINHVEFVFRARTPPPVLSLENKIRTALNDRRGWTMGTVPVNESMLFRGLQPVGSDNLGFVFNQEYVIETWGPFTPVGQ